MPTDGIQHPKFSVPKEVLTKKDITWEKIERICFRGDNRDPSEIFKIGFLPRHHNMIDDDTVFVEIPFESAKKKIIAFTSRFTAAALFPINSNKKNTWVYVFKARHGFDVHRHGYCANVKKGLNANNALGLFVDEIIADKIPPEDIIAAVRILRYEYDSFFDRKPDYLLRPSAAVSDEERDLIDFYNKFGRYNISEYKINPDCTLSENEKRIAIDFIKNEKILNQRNVSSASQLPMPTTGFFYQPKKKNALENLLDYFYSFLPR